MKELLLFFLQSYRASWYYPTF